MTKTIASETFIPSLSTVVNYPYPGAGSFYAEDFPGSPWRTGPWRWSTNGHIIVGFNDGNPDGVVDNAPGELVTARERYLDSALVDAVGVPVVELREMAGEVFAPRYQSCQSCDGRGRYDVDECPCEHCGLPTRPVCSSCKGSGRESAYLPERPMRVAGVPVNVAYLAFGLAVVNQSAGVVRLARVAVKGGDALVVDGDGWRICLMQIGVWASSSIPVWSPA